MVDDRVRSQLNLQVNRHIIGVMTIMSDGWFLGCQDLVLRWQSPWHSSASTEIIDNGFALKLALLLFLRLRGIFLLEWKDL